MADLALDLFVYAPIGFAVTVVEDLPRIVQRGRDRVGTIVDLAPGLVPSRPGPSAPAARPAPPRPAPAPAAPPSGEPAPDPGELAIPGYGSLSASQVVQRLAGLSPEQLEAVRAYESATRHRRTILSRVAQLQDDQGS